MMPRDQSLPDGWRPAPSAKSADPHAGGGLDARQNYLDRLCEFNVWKAEVDALRTELSSINADILDRGCNVEKVHHAQILGTSLVQAQRQMELARQLLEAAATRLTSVRL